MTAVDQAIPPCPAWCTFGKAHTWDSMWDDGRVSRGHDGGAWPPVPAAGGYHSVEVSIGANEFRLEGMGPLEICVEAHGATLTADEARKLAAYLTAAADRYDEIERESGT